MKINTTVGYITPLTTPQGEISPLWRYRLSPQGWNIPHWTSKNNDL